MNEPKTPKIVGFSYSPLSGNDAKLYATSLVSPSPDTQIFHFIPAYFFESLLASKVLSLGRCDLLRGDPSDGQLPEKNRTEHSATVSNLNSGYKIPIMAALPEEVYQQVECLRRCTYAHCWFTGEPNEPNMWRNYGDGESGVCIVSNVGGLVTSIGECQESNGFKIAKVHYSEKLEPATTIPLEMALFHKHSTFQAEKEIRLIFAPHFSKGTYDYTSSKERVLIPVDLSRLFIGIVFGRLMTDDKREQLKYQVAKNIDKEITFSCQR